jgi:tol-pal system protein YbgF
MTPNKTHTFKTRLLLSAGALLLILATPASAGFAQNQANTNQMANRIDQLENQIQTLSRAVYRGEKMPMPEDTGPSASSSALTSMETRLAEMETQQRSMVGQVERLTHDIQQLKDRLDRMASDYEQRFQQQGTGGGSVTGSLPSPTPATSSSGAAELQGDLYATEKPLPTGTLGTLSETGATGADPAGALYENAFADIRAAKYDTAEGKFKKFVESYPNHSLAGNAQYWLGETYYVRGNYQQAAKMFAQGYQDYPQGQKAADSLLKLGLSLAKMGNKEDACLSLHQISKQFPGGQNTAVQRAQQELKQLGCK